MTRVCKKQGKSKTDPNPKFVGFQGSILGLKNTLERI